MVLDDPGRVEAELFAGRLVCPRCGGPLRAWGWSRRRRVRCFAGVRSLRPALCLSRMSEDPCAASPLHSYTPRRRSRSHRRGSARQGNGRGPPHLVVYDRQGAELIEIREYDSLERALEDRLTNVGNQRTLPAPGDRDRSGSRPGVTSWGYDPAKPPKVLHGGAGRARSWRRHRGASSHWGPVSLAELSQLLRKITP